MNICGELSCLGEGYDGKSVLWTATALGRCRGDVRRGWNGHAERARTAGMCFSGAHAWVARGHGFRVAKQCNQIRVWGGHVRGVSIWAWWAPFVSVSARNRHLPQGKHDTHLAGRPWWQVTTTGLSSLATSSHQHTHECGCDHPAVSTCTEPSATLSVLKSAYAAPLEPYPYPRHACAPNHPRTRSPWKPLDESLGRKNTRGSWVLSLLREVLSKVRVQESIRFHSVTKSNTWEHINCRFDKCQSFLVVRLLKQLVSRLGCVLSLALLKMISRKHSYLIAITFQTHRQHSLEEEDVDEITIPSKKSKRKLL